MLDKILLSLTEQEIVNARCSAEAWPVPTDLTVEVHLRIQSAHRGVEQCGKNFPILSICFNMLHLRGNSWKTRGKLVEFLDVLNLSNLSRFSSFAGLAGSAGRRATSLAVLKRQGGGPVAVW